MTLRTATTSTATRKLGTRQVITGACGAALALALAVGIATRLMDEHDGGATGAVGQTAVTSPADAGTTKPWYMRYGEGTTWYLVASAQQAEDAGDAISYRNKALLLRGKPLPDEQIIVVDSALAERQIRFATSEETEKRAAHGLPPLSIVDLRAGADR
jgi:hypothetical protein